MKFSSRNTPPCLLLIISGLATIGQVGCLGGRAPAASDKVGAAQGSPSTSTTGAPSTTLALHNPQDCNSPWTGIVPLRRLHQTQYISTLQAFFGMSLPQVDLPVDETLEMFTVDTVTPPSVLTITQWQAAAEAVASAAMQKPGAWLPCPASAMTAQCINRLIASAGQALYRRPLTSAETQAYTQLVADSVAAGALTTAAQTVLEAMLQSPNFLYQVEVGNRGAALQNGTLVPLSNYELASRLSFMLWNTGPDAQLLALADQGALSDPNQLAAQAERLYNDPNFRNFEDRFFTQLLDTDAALQTNYGVQLPRSGPAFVSSPGLGIVSPSAILDMRSETSDFVDYVLKKDDARLATLLSASYTVLQNPNGALPQIYGVAGSKDPNVPVMLDPTQRSGLLTQSGFLTAHAHVFTTEPVQRGKAVRRGLFCQDLPPPPPNVKTTPPAPGPNETTRQTMAAHESNPSCAACHLLMDPIGLGFENFDDVGIWRTTDNGSPIDASGNIIATVSTNGTFSDAIGLAGRLAQSKDVMRCFATQVTRYATNHVETPDDQCSLSSVQADFVASGGNVLQLLRTVVQSNNFRYLRVDPKGATP